MSNKSVTQRTLKNRQNLVLWLQLSWLCEFKIFTPTDLMRCKCGCCWHTMWSKSFWIRKMILLDFFQDFQWYASKVPKVKKISREVDEAYKNSNAESEIFWPNFVVCSRRLDLVYSYAIRLLLLAQRLLMHLIYLIVHSYTEGA